MGRPGLSPWDDLLRKSVNSRYRQIAESLFRTSRNFKVSVVEPMLAGCSMSEFYLGDYLWSEAPMNDMQLGRLELQGLTPSVAKYFTQWEESITSILDDFAGAIEPAKDLEKDEGKSNSLFLEKW